MSQAAGGHNTERINIAIVRPSSIIISAANYNCQEIGLARALGSFGISTDIYMAGSWRKDEPHIIEEHHSDHSVRIFYIPCIKLPGRQGLFPSLLSLLRKTEYHLIQTYEDSQITSFLVARYGKKKNIPVVLCQGMYEDYKGISKVIVQKIFDSLTGRILRNNITAVIAKTTSAKEYLTNKGFSNIAVCPVGMNVEGFNSSEDIDWRKKLGISEAAKILLYIGVIETRRNVDFLIKLIENLNKDKGDFYLLIAGDGPEKGRCVEMAENLGIGQRIRFVGKLLQADLPSLYKTADLFLLPSSYEIYGMVVMEAMYFGLPVVTSATAGPKEIIENWQDGIIIEGFEIGKWKQAILSVLSESACYRSMKEKALKKIGERFLWEKRVSEYLAVYMAALARKA